MRTGRVCFLLFLCVCLLCSGCGVLSADTPHTEAALTETSYVLTPFTDATVCESSTAAADAPSSETASTMSSGETSSAEAASCTSAAAATTVLTTTSGTAQHSQSQEIRAVWISYLEFASPQDGWTQTAFRAMAQKMVDRIKTGGMNTIFLHVRPCSDAIYRSSLFPYSAYISGTEGKDPGYDALEIFCAYAEKAGLSLHAWINPFRVGDAEKLNQKADTNPAKRILTDDDPDNDGRVVRVNGSLYYDPADAENQDMIVDGVRELLQNYALDGIHIDDYFYPSTDEQIDQKDYDAYLAQGGTASRGDWRRTQINTLVSRLYTCVKSFGSGKIFSISPAMEIEKNRSTLYADVARWAAYDGYCDWLIPQVYVGFAHETHPFRDTVAQWRSLNLSKNVRLLIGLAAYKCGVKDAYAGSGRNEWVENSDVLSRQIRYLRDLGDCFGFAMFSYSYIFGEKMSDNSISEMKSVMDML